MTAQNILAQRCHATVVALNAERGWGLGNDATQQYVAALLPLLHDGASDLQVRECVTYYHSEHARVAALRDDDNFGHDHAWAEWVRQAMMVLHSKGLGHDGDPTLSIDDLAQVAVAALARSLGSYRYQSSFSTWAYRLIVRAAQNEIRHRAARKRSGATLSLQQQGALELPSAAGEQPELVAAARLLAERIEAILADAGDDRLRLIIRLHLLADQRVEEIARLLQLHPSRVRTLLQQARELLREHPELRAWRGEDEPQEPHMGQA